MRALFVRRSAFEALERFSDTEIWRLRRENKALREREAARTMCIETLEAENEILMEKTKSRTILSDKLDKENQALTEENRELRHRLDLVRADLSRARHEIAELKLMKDSLEARIAAPCEV